MDKEEIIKEAERIEKKINSYYQDRQFAIVSAAGVENVTTENLNPDKEYNHPYINVVLNDSKEIKACAYKEKDKYFIEINTGVFPEIREHIHSIVTRKAFERVKGIGHIVPSMVEHLLVEDCYTYLCFHEFFHITNGHCDLITKLQMDRLNEVSDKIGETPELIRQTLEYDADCCAIASMVNEQLRVAGMVNNQLGLNARISTGSLAQTISHILISIFILNSLFYEEFKKFSHCTLEETIDLVERLYHPLPGMRVMYMLLNIDCTIGQCGMYSPEERMEIFEEMFASLKSFVHEYKDVIHSEFLSVAIDVKGIAHLQRIHDNWEKVMNEIPVSYSKLAPYMKFDYEAILKGE